MRTSNGYDSLDLARAAFDAFHASMAQLRPQWGGVAPTWEGSGDQESWEIAAGVAIHHCDVREDEDREISAAKLAAAIHLSFAFSMGRSEEWAALASETKVAWESVARMLAMMIGSDERPDPAEVEAQRQAWVEKRIPQPV